MWTRDGNSSSHVFLGHPFLRVTNIDIPYSIKHSDELLLIVCRRRPYLQRWKSTVNLPVTDNLYLPPLARHAFLPPFHNVWYRTVGESSFNSPHHLCNLPTSHIIHLISTAMEEQRRYRFSRHLMMIIGRASGRDLLSFPLPRRGCLPLQTLLPPGLLYYVVVLELVPAMVSAAFVYAVNFIGLAIAALTVRPPLPAEDPRLLIGELDTIQNVNQVMEKFFAGTNSTTLEQWHEALPTDEEKEQMTQLVADLLNAEDFYELDDAWLRKKFPTIAASAFMTILMKGNYVMVHERHVVSGKFPRMWGYIIIANKHHFKRNLHHSAAHFQSDGDVCNEAAAVFEQTGSRTLVVAGASRYAVKGNNPSPCQKSSQIADAAHSCDVMFHTLNLAVLSAVKQNRDENVFLQWHGMAETSCSASPVFISTGAHGSHPIYDRSIPANKLASVLNAHMGKVVAHTPRTDKTCKLIATTNVFGRAVYGVPVHRLCYTKAKNEDITGQFVHIEQKRKFRDNWNIWADVISEVFARTGGAERYRNQGKSAF
uniref:START domain-containing protein n=2 Tax=Steinernema glaseri TaxID=37863 RepID=A0A1I7YMT9_9BILA